MAMHSTETPLPGLCVAAQAYQGDSRGQFARLFCEQALAPLLNGRRIVQINHSITQQPGTIRGMHFQYAPHAEMKLVRCLRGRVFDVAVDLRQDSPTFAQWHAEELVAGDGKMLVIPEGFAHGFQALDAGSELLYLHTAAYAPEHEGGIRHDDPAVGIQWPMPAAQVSVRDSNFEWINDTFKGLCTGAEG